MYLDSARKANTDDTKRLLFLEFVRNIFDVRDSAEAASRLFPMLEKHVTKKTLGYRRSGRLDYIRTVGV